MQIGQSRKWEGLKRIEWRGAIFEIYLSYWRACNELEMWNGSAWTENEMSCNFGMSCEG